jgi:hypothetical protein
MSDQVASFICENCKKPCQPRMYESGVGADCCTEAYLMIEDDGLLRQLTAEEELDITDAMIAEENAERTPAQRAHQNWLDRS